MVACSSPFVEISCVETINGKVTVVRDDYLQGGTKQRAAVPFLQSYLKAGIYEFVYASPFSGYAQVALAYSCEAVGANCTLFAEKHKGGISEFTNIVSHIANIKLAENLIQAEFEAGLYAENRSQCLKIPLGFNHPLFAELLQKELKIQWDYLCESLGFIPKKLWLPIGSGTLATAFSKIISDETSLHVIDVQVLSSEDQRIKKIIGMSNSKYDKALELFHSPAQYAPPIPSNKYYDAKVWQFVAKHAGPQDVWWNVAK